MKKNLKHVFLVCFFGMYLLTIVLNDGFMALDDYFVGITRYIPAQTSSIMTLVGTDDVKSPLQLLPFHTLAQTGLSLGIESPYLQYRFMLTILSLLAVGMLFFGLKQIQHFEQRRNNPESESFFVFLLALASFYFVMPFSMTRPMFESLAAPWLFLSFVNCYLYDQEGRLKNLLASVFFVSVAFCLRQQLGFCALATLIIPLLKKNYRDFIYAGALGLVFFLIAGIPDYFIRGEYHFSLKAVTIYNVKYGANYGSQPWHFYLVLIFVTGLIPFLFAKYPAGFIKSELKKYRTAWIFLALFVLLHNMFPQKWERFLVSIFPILMVATAPFFWQLWKERRQRKARWISLIILNTILLIPASFTRPQNAILELALNLNKHPEITKVYRTEGQPEWFPEVFVAQKSYVVTDIQNGATPSQWPPIDCQTWVIINEDQKNQYGDQLKNFAIAQKLPSNWIERLAYKLNPSKNQRRASMYAYTCRPE